MRGVIRIGDGTSHGGKVVTGSDTSRVMDKGVARVGDQCTCPVSDHHDCVIVEGDPNVVIDGKPVAFDDRGRVKTHLSPKLSQRIEIG